MLTKKFVRVHKVNIAIVIFLIAFSIIHMIKPDIIYNKEGGFRPFGVAINTNSYTNMVNCYYFGNFFIFNCNTLFIMNKEYYLM